MAIQYNVCYIWFAEQIPGKSAKVISIIALETVKHVSSHVSAQKPHLAIPTTVTSSYPVLPYFHLLTLLPQQMNSYKEI